MHPKLIAQLEQASIFVAKGHGPHIRLGYADSYPSTIFEPFCQLREGIYDIESIGAYSYMGGTGTSMRYIKSIGRFCSIASAIITGQPEHPTHMTSTHPVFYSDWLQSRQSQPNQRSPLHNEQITFQQELRNHLSIIKTMKQHNQTFGRITIGNDVWIGYGAFIRRGVTIGDGAIIASHAVITKDVPPFAIVGGLPAQVLRYRFDDNIIERLLTLQWWKYGLELFHHAQIDPTTLSPENLSQLEDASSNLPFWTPPTYQLTNPKDAEPVLVPLTA